MAKSPAELLEAGRPLTLAGVADGAEGLVVADLARATAAGSRPPATSLVVICRDGPRMAALARALTFFAPDMAAVPALGHSARSERHRFAGMGQEVLAEPAKRSGPTAWAAQAGTPPATPRALPLPRACWPGRGSWPTLTSCES